MARTIIRKINTLSLLLYAALFPYGQIPSFLLSLSTGVLRSIHPTDIVLGIFVFSSILLNRQLFFQLMRSYLGKIIVILMFGLLVNQVAGYLSWTALLYAGRLVTYLLAGYCLIAIKPLKAKQIQTVLLVIGAVIVITGLFQYIFIPDTRGLKIFGWDDHYFRLIGSFFDPAYIGIVLVMTLLLELGTLKNNWLKYIILAITFLAILLTYSRASFVALGAGLFFLLISRSKGMVRLSLFALVLVGCLYLLPRPSSEGVKLERTFSVFLRIKNYKETFSVWGMDPILGVGYNNVCAARQTLFPAQSTTLVSHSCSGSDNSFLLILATTGVVGLIATVQGAYLLYHRVSRKEKRLFVAIGASIVVHSFFSNTLFYPWVMGWMALYVASIIPGSKLIENR